MIRHPIHNWDCFLPGRCAVVAFGASQWHLNRSHPEPRNTHIGNKATIFYQQPTTPYRLRSTDYALPTTLYHFAACGRKTPLFCRFYRIENPPALCYALLIQEHLFFRRAHPTPKELSSCPQDLTLPVKQTGRVKLCGQAHSRLRQPSIRFGSQAEAATSRLSDVPHTSVCGQNISRAKIFRSKEPAASPLFVSVRFILERIFTPDASNNHAVKRLGTLF